MIKECLMMMIFFPSYFEKQIFPGKFFDILEKSPHREFRSYCILFEIPLSVMNFTIVHTFMKCWTDLNCEFNRFHEFKCDSRLFNGNQKYVMIKLAVFLYKSLRTFSVFSFFPSQILKSRVFKRLVSDSSQDSCLRFKWNL